MPLYKPEETFHQLYDRARTFERREQQFTATAAAKGENLKPQYQKAPTKSGGISHNKGQSNRGVNPNSGKDKIPSITFQRKNVGSDSGSYKPRGGCFKC